MMELRYIYIFCVLCDGWIWGVGSSAKFGTAFEMFFWDEELFGG